MSFAVRRRFGGIALGCIQRQRNLDARITKRTVVERRFIHIVPDTRHARVSQGPMLLGPPVPYLRPHKVGEYSPIWPNIAVEDAAIGMAHKVVLR